MPSFISDDGFDISNLTVAQATPHIEVSVEPLSKKPELSITPESILMSPELEVEEEVSKNEKPIESKSLRQRALSDKRFSIFGFAAIFSVVFLASFRSLDYSFLGVTFGLLALCFLVFFIKPKNRSIQNIIISIFTAILYVLAARQIILCPDQLLKTFIYQYLYSWVIVIGLSYIILVSWAQKILASYAHNMWQFLFGKREATITKTIVPKPPDFINEFLITIGEVHDPASGKRVSKATLLTLNAKSLFTNLYVFGSIGTGKTVFLCSILEQLLSFQKTDPKLKPAGLFIDEKGNLCSDIINVAKKIGREDDVYIFNLSGDTIMNPIHEPLKDAEVLARRLKIIFECTIEKEAWIANYVYDFLLNSIKLVRLTSPIYYVTFLDLYELIFTETKVKMRLKYLRDHKIEIIKSILDNETDVSSMINITFLDQQESLLNDFFDKWTNWIKTSDRVYAIVSSSLSQLLGPFTNPKVSYIFSPETPDKINFKGFDWMIQEGKLFVFSVPDSVYEGLGKFVALFLKLPFQRTCLARIPRTTPGTDLYDPSYNKERIILYVADENQNSYHPSDNDSLDKLREAKVVHICLTQSYVSLLAKHTQEQQIRQYLSSFRNKLFLATDDDKSAKYYSELCGQAWVNTESVSYGEGSQKARIDVLHGEVTSGETSFSKNVSTSQQLRKTYDYSIFQHLQMMQGIFTGYDGIRKIPPQYVYVKPAWEDWDKDYFSVVEGMLPSSSTKAINRL